MLSRLAEIVSTFPAIDNHCHNILSPTKDSDPTNPFPLEHAVVESAGTPAASHAQYTLSHARATKQLAALYFCEPSWSAILSARKQLSYENIVKTCFEPSGIQCLLLDDLMIGIGVNCMETKDHDKFVASPVKRVIRIESVAENLFAFKFASTRTIDVAPDSPSLLTHYTSYVQEFASAIESHCLNPEVVAFKSIACYRGGLDVKPGINQDEAFSVFSAALREFISSGRERFRIDHGTLNHTLLCRALKLAGKYNKPVQFHTGLGDTDLSFIHSTPTLLQPLFRAYPETIFVILHASYPFTREAGYLAAMHENVYLDFGEVWPFVSASGQRDVVKMTLELCPTDKLLWSTDGHYWPETFYLGSLQSRQTLYEVLSDIVNRGDLSEQEAISIVERLLFHNANRIYNLGLTPIPVGEGGRSNLTLDVRKRFGLGDK